MRKQKLLSLTDDFDFNFKLCMAEAPVIYESCYPYKCKPCIGTLKKLGSSSGMGNGHAGTILPIFRPSTLRGYCLLLLLSPSPVARRPVVLLAFLLNRGAQKADIQPVFSL
jgi:hypothetical protein